MYLVTERGSFQNGEGETFGESLFSKLKGGLIDNEGYFIPEFVCKLVLEVRYGTEISNDVLEKLLMGE